MSRHVQSLTETEIAEYDLSMMHAALHSNLDDADVLNDVLKRLYYLHPEACDLIERGERILARLILRTNHAERFLRQELKAKPIEKRGKA